MRLNIILFTAIIVIAAATTYMFDNAQHTTPAPESVPAFTFTDTNGKTHAITDFKGKIVLLNFWASWCTPCLKEFPDFIKTANAHPEDVLIIALSSDFKTEAMTKFLTKMKKQFPKTFPTKNMIVALDKDAKITQNLFQITRLPETIVIDTSGKMVEKIIGANWTPADLTTKITALKQKQKLSP